MVTWVHGVDVISLIKTELSSIDFPVIGALIKCLEHYLHLIFVVITLTLTFHRLRIVLNFEQLNVCANTLLLLMYYEKHSLKLLSHIDHVLLTL